MKEQLIFQRILKKKYEELRIENPRLSRRDFSKSMGLSAGAISEIFNGQRKVSLKLEWSDQEQTYFLNLIEIENPKTEIGQRAAIEQNKKLKPSKTSLNVSSWINWTPKPHSID